MARKPLVAGGKDLPDKPRGAPVLQRARQLGYEPGDDRRHVLFEVAALPDDVAHWLQVGKGVEIAPRRLR